MSGNGSVAAPPAAEMMLRTHELRKSYARTRALDGLSINVPRGSIYGFVGPNGAGKTTTMRIMATLLLPDAGEVWVDGQPLTSNTSAVRNKIGYMPDFFGVYDNLTVAEYLAFYASAYRVPTAETRHMIGELLELVDLGSKRDELVEGLSRGMKQRLGLARCLVHNPQVLLLDEPASGMDPRARVEMREIVKELQRLGKTVLVSSHILLELSEMCSHIGIIQGGRLIREGPVGVILSSLKAARTVRIGLLGDLDAAADTVKRQRWVTDVQIVDGALEAAVSGEEQDLADLLHAIVEAGVRVVQFAPASNSLEEIFMQLTESEES
ncbi:MAG TPA: ABC transporter ATP-binding protein [Chloroflexota bacterium]|nr:ABC transporter ATP-binding protein [Chloroflexota bacterium]